MAMDCSSGRAGWPLSPTRPVPDEGSASGVDPTYIDFVMTGMYILKLSAI